MVDIDNDSFKVLMVVYKCSPITKDQLSKMNWRRAKTNLDYQIRVLYKRKYITNPVVGEDLIGNQLTDENVFLITESGRVYVENKIQDDRRWRIPVIISCIALLFSLIALLPQLSAVIELTLRLLGLQ